MEERLAWIPESMHYALYEAIGEGWENVLGELLDERSSGWEQDYSTDEDKVAFLNDQLPGLALMWADSAVSDEFVDAIGKLDEADDLELTDEEIAALIEGAENGLLESRPVD